jgi:tripartite ATP-independent transporter DctM subunit
MMNEPIVIPKQLAAERIDQVVKKLESVNPFIHWYCVVGMIFFICMVFLTFLDVILRYFFRNPISGSIEITELMMVILVFSSLSYAQLKDAHVTMDILTSKLGKNKQNVLEGVCLGFSIVLFFVIAWRSYLAAYASTHVTAVLRIPLKYVGFQIPFSCLLLIIVLVKKLLLVIQHALTVDRRSLVYIFCIPLVCCVAVFFLLYVHPWEINLSMMGIVGIVSLFLLFTIGMPIAYSLFATGFIFLSYVRGIDAGLEIIGVSWFETVRSYPWSPLMFFLFMGYICFYSGLGSDLFRMANTFIGHLRGGLTIAAVIACAAFGAVVGDTISGSVAMTAIGLPEMRKYKYSDYLSIGTLTTAGTLGTLIPPSIGFIIYAILAEQSVGDLFIAGIIPGVLCAFLFILVILAIGRIRPDLMPPAEKSNWDVRLKSLKVTWPTAVLFILVIGGIYAGIFTATEGGGIGAFGALVIGVVLRRLSWKRFVDALTESAKFIAMMFTILGGANVFGYFISMSNIPYTLADFVSSMAVSPALVMVMVVAVLFVLGCFLPAIPMVLICVPIFLPVANAFHWDLIWFGVVVVCMLNLACVTPPFGINLFVIKGVSNVDMALMYKSVLPFILCLCVGLCIILLIPSLSTWLPGLLH